jgi:hypothetical protein
LVLRTGSKAASDFLVNDIKFFLKGRILRFDDFDFTERSLDYNYLEEKFTAMTAEACDL